MKKLTIIDSYDYAVDFIENIASAMSMGVCKFGKYSVSNGEISKMLIETISQMVKNEKNEDVKSVTDHLLTLRPNKNTTRKLAIEIDDELINSINEAISIILSEGYKKIPSRTMFFRESLRTSYDFLIHADSRAILLEIGGYDLFAGKVLTGETHSVSTGKIGYISSLFWSQVFSGAMFFKSISDNYEQINNIMENDGIPEDDIIIITEKILKYSDDVVEEHKIEKDRIRFTIHFNDTWIEIPKKKLDSLIMQIDPIYSKLRNKTKFLILLSSMEKEFVGAEIKLNVLTGNKSEYVKKNMIDFSDLYLMSEGLALMDDGILFDVEKNPEIKKLFRGIINQKIRQDILGSSIEYKDDDSYNPLLFFLSSIFSTYTAMVLGGTMYLNRWRGAGHLEQGLLSNLPEFRVENNEKKKM